MAHRLLFLLSTLLAVVRGDFASTPAPTGYPSAAVYSTTSATLPFGPPGYLDPSPGPSSALYTSAGYVPGGTTSTPGTSPTLFTTAGLFNSPQILSSSFPAASPTTKTTTSSSSSENTPLPTPSKGEQQSSNQGYSNSPSLSSYAVHEPPYPPCNPSSHLLPPSRNPFMPSLYNPNLNQAFNQFIPRYNTNPNSFNPFSIFPYYQHPHTQVPNPLAFLNNLAPPASFHAMVHSPAFRGPVPSPGYYSPNHPPPHYTQSYPRYPVPSRNYLSYTHQ